MKSIFTLLLSVTLSVITFAQSKNVDPQVKRLYNAYIALKDALVASDNTGVQKQAKNFAENASATDYKIVSEGNIDALIKNAMAIAKTDNIKSQRAAFNLLSTNMIKLVDNVPVSDKPLYVQHCPMAKGSWISNEKEIKNPYYGDQMLTCGSVVKEIE